MAGLRLQFYTDPAEFLAAAGGHLAADPVISTVVTTIAHRARHCLAASRHSRWQMRNPHPL
jgi:hypothetical protein